MRTYLVCESAEHAEFVDQLVLERLREADNAHGSGWSGVWTDGTRFGILWAAPVSDLFGVPEDFPELVVVEETEETPWVSYVEPAPEGEEASP